MLQVLHDVATGQAGHLAMGSQIVEASIMNTSIVDAGIVEAPKPRHAKEEQAGIKAGRVPKGWQDKPHKLHKLRQKDMDASWTLKRGRVQGDDDGAGSGRAPCIPIRGVEVADR